MNDRERIVQVLKDQIALCGPDPEQDRWWVTFTADDARRILEWLTEGGELTMPDREKVIKGLEICKEINYCCQECPYYDRDAEMGCHSNELMEDALALLKEQETVEHALEVLRKAGWKETHDVPFPVELLKEQEAVKRSSRRGTNGLSIIWTCGKCGADLEPNNAKAKYCSNCGQAVKWE